MLGSRAGLSPIFCSEGGNHGRTEYGAWRCGETSKLLAIIGMEAPETVDVSVHTPAGRGEKVEQLGVHSLLVCRRQGDTDGTFQILDRYLEPNRVNGDERTTGKRRLDDSR